MTFRPPPGHVGHCGSMAAKPTGGPNGRPSRLTEPVRTALLAAIRSGCPYSYACAAAGVSYSTFLNWTRQGRSDLTAGDTATAFAAFLLAVKRAEAEGVAARLEIINEAARRNWAAAAWVLERRLPQHFATHRSEIKELKRALDALARTLSER